MVMDSHIAYASRSQMRTRRVNTLFKFVSYSIDENRVSNHLWFVSMKRYAAVKVRGGVRPGSRMLEGAGPVGPALLEPDADLVGVSLERR